MDWRGRGRLTRIRASVNRGEGNEKSGQFAIMAAEAEENQWRGAWRDGVRAVCMSWIAMRREFWLL